METGHLYLDLHVNERDPVLSVETRLGRVNDPALQAKSVTPTEQSQTVSPDSGYDGLSSVGVGAIPSTYVGSQIPRRTSAQVTVNGPTVTIPAGYYASQQTKTVQTAERAGIEMTVSQTTGVIVIRVDQDEGYVEEGVEELRLSQTAVQLSAPTMSRSERTITATVTQPAGYTPGGTKHGYYILNAQSVPEIAITFNDTVGEFVAEATYPQGWKEGSTTKSGSYLLTTQAGKTVTPTTSTQTAVAAKRYTTGDIKVGPIPPQYIVPSGTKTITANGVYDVTPYASADVSVSSAGDYVLKAGDTMTGPLGMKRENTISSSADAWYLYFNSALPSSMGGGTVRLHANDGGSSSIDFWEAGVVGSTLTFTGTKNSTTYTPLSIYKDRVKISSKTILDSNTYGSSLPASGSTGQVFFLLQT